MPTSLVDDLIYDNYANVNGIVIVFFIIVTFFFFEVPTYKLLVEDGFGDELTKGFMQSTQVRLKVSWRRKDRLYSILRTLVYNNSQQRTQI